MQSRNKRRQKYLLSLLPVNQLLLKVSFFFGIRESIFKEKKHEKERKWIGYCIAQIKRA